ncbi:MAG: hypothetical protein M1840_002138 [Geoglossum simile]|nr:MAG: hypothetical protein M1840_002138 [Geoglossum simile]
MTHPAPIPDPSTLTLREATPAEKVLCWRAGAVSWAGRLTVDDYILRETINGSGFLTGNGGIKYWVFVGSRITGGQDVGVGGEEVIYASVESLWKEIVVRDGEGVRRERCWAVASVFTPEKWRRRGIAAEMMRKLGEWFDGEGGGEGRISVLYSDVGEYYSSLGWPSFPSLETHLPPCSSHSTDAKPLAASDLPPLCDRDVAAVVQEIRDVPLSSGTHTRLAFLPSYAQAEWHFGAEDHTALKLFTERRPEVKGAISQSGETWGYWVHDFTENVLIFLRLVSLYPPSSSAEEEKALLELSDVLRAAQAEAAIWAFKRVVLWNPDRRALGACRLALGLGEGEETKVRTRTEGSIPCLRWKGGGGDLARGVEWAALEKYSWC